MVDIVHETDWRDSEGRWRPQSALGPGPVLIVVGDAAAMTPAAFEAAQAFFEGFILPCVERHSGIVIDGGTDAGVMAVLGQSRARRKWQFPLLGIAPSGCVVLHPESRSVSKASPEPNHSSLVLTLGDQWGDECGPMAELAAILAGDFPVTVIVHGGGRVTRMDVEHAVARGFRIAALRGTGRVADALADAQRGHVDDTDLGRWASSIVAAHPIEGVPIGAPEFDARHWFASTKTS